MLGVGILSTKTKVTGFSRTGNSCLATTATSSKFGWWSKEGLDREEELAAVWRIPPELRGPPTGPGPDTPKFWKGRKWRANRQTWASSGGQYKGQRDNWYGKSGRQDTDA